MAPTSCPQRPCREPLFDIHPLTGATIEVFYADGRLETFGRYGAGWFWCCRRRGSSARAGAYRSVFAELRRLSARDECGGADLVVTE